jgi:formylglycine-generating enzyme required for sulfatase activity
MSGDPTELRHSEQKSKFWAFSVKTYPACDPRRFLGRGPLYLRTASRNAGLPRGRNSSIGFRLARNID